MLDRGTVVVAALDPTLGHEQRGARPCVVVSDPAIAGDQRYPMIAVVPLTATPGTGLLYPPLEPGSGGLRKRSFALVDQIRSIDKRLVVRVFPAIRAEELTAIDDGLTRFLGLNHPVSASG